MSGKPFVKWVGGKGKLIPELIKYIPKSINNYYEPFVGGGALFYSLCSNQSFKIKKSYINDINGKLINAYKQIKDNSEKLIGELKKIEIEYRELDLEKQKEYFYKIRKLYNENNISDLTRAVYLIFLNKTGFNGMYRENSSGGFNIPFGDQPNPTICDENNIIAVSKLLQNTIITSESFEIAVSKCKKGDFVYFDPPYHPINKTSSFTSYSKNSFNQDDQEKLCNVFKKLDKKGCFVMLSNSNTPFIKKLYKDYNINYVMAARSINSDGNGRGKIKEIIVTNYTI